MSPKQRNCSGAISTSSRGRCDAHLHHDKASSNDGIHGKHHEHNHSSSRAIHHPFTTNSFIERGTRVHVINVVASILAMIHFGLLVPVSSSSSSSKSNLNNSNKTSINTGHYDYSFLCTFIFWFGYLGLLYDNFVTGIGKYHIRDNSQVLKTLTRYRFVWHAAGIPLFFVPVTIVASYNNLITNSTITMAQSLRRIPTLKKHSERAFSEDFSERKKETRNSSLTGFG